MSSELGACLNGQGSIFKQRFGIVVSVAFRSWLSFLCESLKLVLPPGGAGEKLQGLGTVLGPYQGVCQWGVRKGASGS